MWIYEPTTLAIVEVNPAAVASYGYSREDFLKMTILDIRPPSDVAKVLHSALSEHPVAGQVWRHEKQNGIIIHVRITSGDIEFNGRPARVVHAMEVIPNTRADIPASGESRTDFTKC